MQVRRVVPFVVAFFALALAASGSVVASPTLSNVKKPDDDSGAAVHQDTSLPLIALAPAPPQPDTGKKEKEPKKGPPVPGQSATPDPVVQDAAGTAAAPALGVGFDGVGNGFSGPSGTYSVDSAPPDPNAAVGPNHVFEVVNEAIAIFNKSGTPIYGPVPTNTLWSGFGGGCQTNNDGDATVAYDRLAEPLDHQPVLGLDDAVPPVRRRLDERRSDRHVLPLRVPVLELPRLSEARRLAGRLLHDLQHVHANGSTFAGPEVCAYDRAKMLAGQPATQQCFTLGTAYGGLLPADLDGATPPPAGRAELRRSSFGANSLAGLWKFHVDWTTPANSTLHRPDDARGRGLLARVLRRRHLHPAVGDEREARFARRPADVPPRVPQLRRPRVARRRPHASPPGARRRSAGTSCAIPNGNADRLPAGDLRPRRDLPLDGQHRDGPRRAISALGYSASSCVAAPGHPLHRAPGRRRRWADDAGRGHGRHRRRLPDRRPHPLGRLHEHDRRPRRRLHVLVHERVHPGERELQLAHADRLVQAARLQHRAF